MNTFQLLKSGTSFKRDRIEKVQNLFKPEVVKTKKERQAETLPENDNELAEIDKLIEAMKLTKPKPKEADKYAADFKHLVNKRADTLNKLRTKYGIKVDSKDCPDPLFSFLQIAKCFDDSKYLLKTIKSCGYKIPTPVQMQAMPIIKQKRSAIILAETGSGKSMAFAVPLLEMIKRGQGLRAVILAPTRELTIQLYKEFLILSEQLISVAPRVKFLTKHMQPLDEAGLKKFIDGQEILIASPLKFGQICELFPTIKCLEYIVIDEADKMFEMGFLEQVDQILSNLPNQSKIAKFMFSATMQPPIQELVRKVMEDPIKVQIGIQNATAAAVKQNIVYVGREDAKLFTLRQKLKEGFEPPMLIFVQSKVRAKELYHELINDGVNVNVIHGDKQKVERDEIIKQFRTGDIWVLICTDLMARGIDFKTVNSVVNFDFPTSLVSYIHRVGRTGRAGREGKATTYFTDADVPYVQSIANLMKKSGTQVPDWMLNLKSAHNKEWKKIEVKPLRRQTISTSIRSNTDFGFVKQLKKQAAQNNPFAQKAKNNDDDSIEFGSDGEDILAEEIEKHDKQSMLRKRTRQEVDESD